MRRAHWTIDGTETRLPSFNIGTALPWPVHFLCMQLDLGSRGLFVELLKLRHEFGVVPWSLAPNTRPAFSPLAKGYAQHMMVKLLLPPPLLRGERIWRAKWVWKSSISNGTALRSRPLDGQRCKCQFPVGARVQNTCLAARTMLRPYQVEVGDAVTGQMTLLLPHQIRRTSRSAWHSSMVEKQIATHLRELKLCVTRDISDKLFCGETDGRRLDECTSYRCIPLRYWRGLPTEFALRLGHAVAAVDRRIQKIPPDAFLQCRVWHAHKAQQLGSSIAMQQTPPIMPQQNQRTPMYNQKSMDSSHILQQAMEFQKSTPTIFTKDKGMRSINLLVDSCKTQTIMS